MNLTVTSTQELPTSSNLADDEHCVLGLPAVDFYAIHYLALVVLACSIIVSSGVLVHLLACSGTAFRERPIGERLVVYLAFCDLIYSVSHSLDHGYMVATEDYPPDALCRLFAILLLTFILAQSIMVTFTAINCFYMVVMERRFELGPYDWRLLVPALGGPLVLAIGAAIPGILGAGPMWCLVNTMHEYGGIAAALVAISLLTVMVINMLFYGLVWRKLKKAAGVTGRQGKYDNLAKTLMVFVAVYILQYFAAVITNLWEFAGPPPTPCIILTVIFTNLGGVFNFVAYTVLRRRSMRTQPTAGGTQNTNSTVATK